MTHKATLHPTPSLALGIVIALSGVLVLTAMDGVAKILVTGELPLVQILAVRSLIIIVILSTVVGAQGKIKSLKPVHWRPQLLRGLVGLVAPLCFFSALVWLPLTNVTVVSYTSIFATTALSAWLLGERVGVWRWSAIVLGYTGVTIAIQPTGEGSVIGYGLVLLASVSYALVAVLGKRLSRTDSTNSLVMTYNVMLGITCSAFLPWFWQTLDFKDLIGIGVFAIMGLTGQWLITDAYRRLDGSLVAPLEYTSLLWAVMIDVVLFQTPPSGRVLIGAAIIIGASLIVIFREQRRNPI